LQKGDPGIQGPIGPIGPANTKGTVSLYDRYWVFSQANGLRFYSPIPCYQSDKYMIMLESIEYMSKDDPVKTNVWCENGWTLNFVVQAGRQAGALWSIYKIN
jgi:hypothetical protein